MAKKKTKLAAPKFTAVSRSDNKITFTWNKGDSGYTDINGKWKEYLTGEADDMHKLADNKIGKNTLTKTITLTLTDYYPYTYTKNGAIKTHGTLDKVKMWVQGEEKSKATDNKLIKSDWAGKTFQVYPPANLSVACSLHDTYPDSKVFSWSSSYSANEYDSTTSKIISYFECATALVQESNIPDGSAGVAWQSYWNTNDHSYTTPRENIVVGDSSYTRYFAVRARGPGGDSTWVYSHYVYANPSKPTNVSAEAVKSGDSYIVYVAFNTSWTYARPFEEIDIEYAIETPVTSSYTDENGYKRTVINPPSSFSWTSAKTYANNWNDTFIIGSSIPADKCLYIRVNLRHNGMPSPTYGDAVYVKNSYGPLANPSNLSVTVNTSYLATINSITNNSDISASYVAIYYRTSSDQTPKFVGVWPSGNSSPISVQLPDPGEANEYSLGIQTYLTDYYAPSTAKTPPDITYYDNGPATSVYAKSSIIWDDRPVPKQPKITSLTQIRDNTIRVEWDWKWGDANGVELSWANHKDAWESTDEPTTYTISPTTVTGWNISGLDYGEWHFRVRLFKTEGDATTYGTYSEIGSYTLTASPPIPYLTITPEVVRPSGSISCYWAYTSNTEGDSQLGAEICEVTISDGQTNYGSIIGSTIDDQTITFDIEKLEWDIGLHYLAVRVTTSNSGEGDWSVPQPVKVLNPIVARITSTSLVSKPTVIDGQTGEVKNILSLTSLPLHVVTNGAGSNGTMTYIIERVSNSPDIMRPNEVNNIGFEGETVAIKSDISGNDVYIDYNDLYSCLDDGAYYNIIAIAEDSYGYTSDPDYITFRVNWDHQAIKPVAEIEADQENDVVFITPIAPEKYFLTTDTSIVSGTSYYTFASVASPVISGLPNYYEWLGDGYILTEDEEIEQDKIYYTKTQVVSPSAGRLNTYYTKPYPGDACDIYRLSSDKPELIVSGAEFDTTYVDPYPALGSFGGHRIVYRTVDGDYYTDNGAPAWIDYDEDDGDIINRFATIIDFEGDKLILPYDLSLSTKWSKDFTETKYLGGSIQGDWNPAVSKTGTIKTRVAVKEDSELIIKLRALAIYAGLCHVRTPDGSSYAANIDVTEDREEKKINMIASFSLEITRVDTHSPDGLTYKNWNPITSE